MDVSDRSVEMKLSLTDQDTDGEADNGFRHGGDQVDCVFVWWWSALCADSADVCVAALEDSDGGGSPIAEFSEQLFE